MKVRPAPLVVIVLVVLARAVFADRQRNIFDDDWTPPKSAQTPRQAPATKLSNPPVVESVQPPVRSVPKVKEAITEIPVAPSQAAARRAVPSKDQQAAVRVVMREVFAQQLADRSVAAREKLAAALLAQADKSDQVPVDQFVLLAAAIDAAIDAANLPVAFGAADRIAKAFDVDGLGLKLEAATARGPRPPSPQSAEDNVRVTLELANDLAAADDFASALRVCAAAQSAAAGDAELRAQIQQRQRELAVAREAAERFSRNVAKLKASPDDPALNLAVGRYACFVKREWEGGLTMLAKGSDPALKALAVQELALPSDAEAIGRIADAWWDTAARQPDAGSKSAITAHAASLYERALDGSTGLRRQLIEKRIAEAARVATPSGRLVSEIIVEALIDGDSTLHVTPQGIYWRSHGVAKPGLHDRHDEPTYVNGVAWRPRWSQPGERGNDTSDLFRLRIGKELDFQAEVVGCADKPGTDRIDKRDPIRSKLADDEFVVTIPDGQIGAKWYRLRVFRAP